ncbi:thiamine diphosphokinase [Pseudorhodobacter aquimaris]|uniref:thiamine diphosphokinase n=1 Tax=Pseudorhodobacter aquimaris TaxID=687412 RepID=UPI000AE2B822|nr:thiamine diphosphokinase [Pseudorhodobacter aquimaris]
MTKSAIVDSRGGVTLIAGGPVRRKDLIAAQGLAPCLVAADGGADRALALGAHPAAVIGDLDSITQAARTELGTAVHHIAEQDSTDFDKALRNINAPFVLGLGLLGGRVDHELSALAVLARRAAAACLLIGPQDVIFAAPPLLTIAMRAGDRFSLFPFAPVTGRSEGLQWPIEGIGFSPSGRGGTSNMALGPVRLEMDAPGMLVIVPRARLREALEARLVAEPWKC